MMHADTAAGLTVADVARRYRVGEDKVRGWIRRGELAAINTADRRCARPRYVVTAESLEQFERGRQVATPPKPAKRRKRTTQVDYFAHWSD
jgi:transposase